jgi:hypothetical protein
VLTGVSVVAPVSSNGVVDDFPRRVGLTGDAVDEPKEAATPT